MPTVDEISELLEQRIEAGNLPANSWLPTAQSLAAELTTSRLTVRKAIDHLVERGLLQRREGAGILVTGAPLARTTLLYVGPSTEHFHKDVHGALLRQSQEHGLRFLSFHWPSGGEQPNLALFQREVESADWLIVDLTDRAEEVLSQIPEPKPPAVILTPYPLPLRAYQVMWREERSIQLVVDRLVDLGHRDFLFVTHALLPEFAPRMKRNPANGVPAFHAALDHYGLRERADVFFMGHEPERVYIEGLKRLLDRQDRPTAVLCEGDYRARCVYMACSELGLSISADLSVTGLGNTPWSQVMLPPMTTVSYEEETLAWMVLALIQSRLPTAEPFCCGVEPRLIERESIGPVPR